MIQNSRHGTPIISFLNIKNNFIRAELTLQAEPLIAAKAKERQIRKPDSVVANFPPQEEAGKTRDELTTLTEVQINKKTRRNGLIKKTTYQNRAQAFIF